MTTDQENRRSSPDEKKDRHRGFFARAAAQAAQPPQRVPQPDRIRSYFRMERVSLTLVTVSGLLYNAGMVAGPYFEGQLAQRLYDILGGRAAAASMLSLAGAYLAVIAAVQALRAVKRFYVRRFANNTSRNMRHMLYNSLVNTPAGQPAEALGSVMTKAVADVDACTEGMRKFTTELFDTGVVLVAYLTMLFVYDWRLALISCAFLPFAYLFAELLKGVVTRCSAAYRKSAGELNGATMDRVANAVTYRVYGCEGVRDQAYERHLADYEKRGVAANIWENTMQPLYSIVSMCGAVPILWLGARNVLGTGWTAWNIAAFTTFLACFAKLATKSSHAAKLFNSVQKAKVSWVRIKPLLKEYQPSQTPALPAAKQPAALEVKDLAAAWPGGAPVVRGISFSARAGQIIGVTGAVACGKSTLGKVFAGEVPYEGSARVNGCEVRALTDAERSALVCYMGHESELLSGTVAENIRLGVPGDVWPALRAAALDGEVRAMPAGENTLVGSGGIRLSGGQQARTALARTLYNARPLLVLDDPFSAVDRATEAVLLQNLRALCADRVVLLLSHRLALFAQLDGVLYLENGTGVFGTHAQLLERAPGYAALCRRQTAEKAQKAPAEGGERA